MHVVPIPSLVLVGAVALVVLLVLLSGLVAVRLRRQPSRSRRSWSATDLPTWGGVQRAALVHKVAHPKRVPRLKQHSK